MDYKCEKVSSAQSCTGTGSNGWTDGRVITDTCYLSPHSSAPWRPALIHRTLVTGHKTSCAPELLIHGLVTDHLPEKILPLIVRSRPGTSQTLGTAPGKERGYTVQTVNWRLLRKCLCLCVQTWPRAPSGQTWDRNVTMDWGVRSVITGSQTRFADQEMGNELFVATLPSLAWVNGNGSIHYPRLIVGMLITPHSEPTPILSFSLNFKWIMETLRRSDLGSGLTDTSPGNRPVLETGQNWLSWRIKVIFHSPDPTQGGHH